MFAKSFHTLIIDPKGLLSKVIAEARAITDRPHKASTEKGLSAQQVKDLATHGIYRRKIDVNLVSCGSDNVCLDPIGWIAVAMRFRPSPTP